MAWIKKTGVGAILLLVLLINSPVMPAMAAEKLQILDQTPQAPHNKIGELEVFIVIKKSSGQTQNIKDKLIQKLQKDGKKYNADAIINVSFYPNPAELTFFRNDKFYARGTMIQFIKFPEAPQKKTNALEA